MYVDISRPKQYGKVYTRYLLRESYRENGKVKQRIIANLSHCFSEEIKAIKLALKYKGNISDVLERGIDYNTGTVCRCCIFTV